VSRALDGVAIQGIEILPSVYERTEGREFSSSVVSILSRAERRAS
jgi:hypothetical protein